MKTKQIVTETKFEGFTPGPWDAHDDDGTGTLPCVLSPSVNAGGNFYVAQCNSFADAALIAAAPDLLAENAKLRAACKRLIINAACDCAEGGDGFTCAVCEAKAALGKDGAT